MKLTRLEKQLLRAIQDHYPFIWNKDEAEEILTKLEKPLITKEDLVNRFRTYAPDEIEKSIKRLISYQCVKEVYLYEEGDYITRILRPGKSIRVVPIKMGKGKNGLQITSYGKEITSTFFRNRASVILSQWGKKIIEEQVPLFIAFLLGSGLTFLGINLKTFLK